MWYCPVPVPLQPLRLTQEYPHTVAFIIPCIPLDLAGKLGLTLQEKFLQDCSASPAAIHLRSSEPSHLEQISLSLPSSLRPLRIKTYNTLWPFVLISRELFEVHRSISGLSF